METRAWQSKGDKASRRSPRRKSKTCGRPFKAPRKVKTCKTVPEVETSEAQLIRQDIQQNHDTEIKQISGTENERDIQARAEQEPHVIPFIPCIRLMSERESVEMARHGEVLRWSSDEDGDNTQKTTLASDTTGSTPDIFKSPELSKGRVPGAIITDTINDYVIEASPKKRQTLQGVQFVGETEMQESSVDSPENRPVVRSLRNRQKINLSLQQITDCPEGPKGDRAIGVTIAKTFGGYEYRGTIDKFRGERGRYIYHVTYDDGDEEELFQKELRDCYILALAPDIEAQWAAFNKTRTKKSIDENLEGSVEADSEDQALSDGEGSLYDKCSDEDELQKKEKKRRKEKTSRTAKKGQRPISGLVLPVPGDKPVAGEAFAKLNHQEKELVADNKINRKTKKVLHS
jgi:hypothetical protein